MTAFLGTLLHYSFMRHAFEAGTAVAVAAGVVGYFVVIRRSAFAAHALSHAGFAGAAGAVVLGIDPIYGLLAFTVGGATLMGALGRRMAQRDVEIGTVLAFMLGLGVLFISLYGGYASEAYSLLFGQVLGISATDVLTTVAAAAGTLVVVAALYRPLLFCSLDEDVAAARGVRTTALGMVFLVLLAVAT
ncbi:MAG: metal ABC transporter permease, partial [Acidimicrobiales bacterium]